ncbi:VQ motif-containing protein [Perilla frutescens var. hirtella]|nr:VQ motif-containing protein [Perilla frutescens var. frutescens]KAH6776227.1 VQ motif-containing protein [Perilla frutescens var. hirtella]
MEQYAAMSEQIHNYSLWEQDYYSSGEMGMFNSQGFLDGNEFCTNFYAKNVPINLADDHQRAINFPNAVDVARNVQHVVSSPETANSPGKPKRRRSKGGAAAEQSTTFLNASISNFRALVQQHTGCHNTNSSPKGPITLCFANAEARQLNNQYHYS